MDPELPSEHDIWGTTCVQQPTLQQSGSCLGAQPRPCPKLSLIVRIMNCSSPPVDTEGQSICSHGNKGALCGGNQKITNALVESGQDDLRANEHDQRCRQVEVVAQGVIFESRSEIASSQRTMPASLQYHAWHVQELSITNPSLQRAHLRFR